MWVQVLIQPLTVCGKADKSLGLCFFTWKKQANFCGFFIEIFGYFVLIKILFIFISFRFTKITDQKVLFNTPPHSPTISLINILHSCDGFPQWLSSRESTCNVGDEGSGLGLGRLPGGGNGNPFQHSCLGNPMDKGSGEVGGWYSPKGGKESDTTEHTHKHFCGTFAIQMSQCWYSIAIWSPYFKLGFIVYLFYECGHMNDMSSPWTASFRIVSHPKNLC